MFVKKGNLFGDLDRISVFWSTEESPSLTINVWKRNFQTNGTHSELRTPFRIHPSEV